jgi:hypothetical protein
MRVLIGCEFSGIVRDAFAALGHDAWSCDLLPSERPGNHIVGDVLSVAGQGWDLAIFHPPCTYLCTSGNRWFKPEYAERFPDRVERREQAVKFVRALMATPVRRIAIENPISILSTRIRKPDQAIQPYEFGHPDRKTTWLWLKNLPPLLPTRIVEPLIRRNKNGQTASVHHDFALNIPYAERWKFRSRTYEGIAAAMAEQWGGTSRRIAQSVFDFEEVAA